VIFPIRLEQRLGPILVPFRVAIYHVITTM